MLLLLFACAPDDSPPPEGFHVVGVTPDDGATDVVEAHIPELRFSSPSDPDTCNTATIRLDGVLDDGTVAFPVALALNPLDDGSRVQLTHDAPLPTGWTYILTVRGDGGCSSLDGDVLAPFASTFAVP